MCPLCPSGGSVSVKPIRKLHVHHNHFQTIHLITIFKILRDLLFGNLTCKYKLVAMETDIKVCAIHNFTPSTCSFGKELFGVAS